LGWDTMTSGDEHREADDAHPVPNAFHKLKIKLLYDHNDYHRQDTLVLEQNRQAGEARGVLARGSCHSRHTTGGGDEISKEVGAVPVVNWNGCWSEGERNRKASVFFVTRSPGQRLGFGSQGWLQLPGRGHIHSPGWQGCRGGC